jgi:Holliday junction DNA helicase RuvA
MIGSLTGKLRQLDPMHEGAAEIVLDVHGVGYAVTIGSRDAAGLGPIGSELSLSVYTHVREGAITLYGFASALDRKTFDVLLGAHGVGPALALAILSVHPPASLARAIGNRDLAALTAVPGIGKRTAERLIVELAERLDVVGAPADATSGARANPAALVEVREALGALGYGNDEIRVALERLDEDGSVEELLREALAQLAPRR